MRSLTCDEVEHLQYGKHKGKTHHAEAAAPVFCEDIALVLSLLAAASEDLIAVHSKASLHSLVFFLPSLLCKLNIAYTKYTCQEANEKR